MPVCSSPISVSVVISEEDTDSFPSGSVQVNVQTKKTNTVADTGAAPSIEQVL